MNLIDKDVLVEEIKRQQRRLYLLSQSNEVELRKGTAIQNGVLCSLLSFINNLEIKEVDLESEQRMRECPYRQVVCTMYEGKILECKGACSWVVDYPKLKELKSQKGE